MLYMGEIVLISALYLYLLILLQTDCMYISYLMLCKSKCIF